MNSAFKPLLWVAGIVIVVALVNACNPDTNVSAKAPKSPRAAAPAFVSSTVNLPGGDGRVHIVAIPGRYGSSACVVVVTPTSSGISCPTEIEASDPFEGVKNTPEMAATNEP